MNVCFVVKGARKSADDVMAIPKECVDNNGGEGGEAETVSNALGRRDVYRRISFVFSLVKRAVRQYS